MEMPRLAKKAAKEAGVRLMVHIGDTQKKYDPNVIRELLPILEEAGHHLGHAVYGVAAARQCEVGADAVGADSLVQNFLSHIEAEIHLAVGGV